MGFEEQLRAVVWEHDVAVAVLFGSCVDGVSRANSDLDVAVLPEENTERRRLQNRLAAALIDFSPSGRVDVVFLDEASTLLRQRIMESGRLLVCRRPDRWKALRVQTMWDHADREWIRRLFRRSRRQRLTEGGDSSGRSGRALGSLERTRGLSR